jgi:threonyl-tRNA synthetase
MVDALAALHDFDWRGSSLSDFGKPDGFHERQVERWTGQLASYKGRELPGLHRVTTFLSENLPGSFEPSLMHGDFHMFNALIAAEPPGKVTAIIDWETATIGDPLLDLIGFCEIWGKATEALREALDRHGVEYKIKEGDAAFYGPKIDIDVRDAIGRKWQLSTIQCDFNLPERFELEYVGSDGARHRPIMLHRALFGSIERFFGVLIEHYAGAFPTWLSPEQVRVLPVALAHDEYAQAVVKQLKKAGFRVEIDHADEQLGKRIRNAKTSKVPYVLVVGDDDVAHQSVGVNPRGGEVERDVSVSDFIARLGAEVAEGQLGDLDVS